MHACIVLNKMAASIGITTWIKQEVMKGVAFRRVGCPGQGNKEQGLKVGRVIDEMFKVWCRSNAIPEGKPWAKRRMAYIAAALKHWGIEPSDANVFVRRGGIKTHLDGLGTRNGKACVIELKTTQASLANHRAAYDVACSNKPLITVAGEQVPNTERTHHQLQLAFGVLAAKAATGVVVVSTSDGAAVYPVLANTPPRTFDYTAPEKPKRKRQTRRAKGGAGKRKVKLPKWPGAFVAAKGWTDVRILKSGVAVLTKDGKTAVAIAATNKSAKPPHALLKEAAEEASASIQLVAAPSGAAWRCYRIARRYIGSAEKTGARATCLPGEI